MAERLFPALCWCESETVLCTSRQIIDGDVHCDRCRPGQICDLCAAEHATSVCPLAAARVRHHRSDRGRSRRGQVTNAALAAPIIGDWNGWWTFALIVVVVAYIIPGLLHLRDRHLADTPTDDSPQPGDVSTLTGWDEYVIGTRLEREIGRIAEEQQP